MGTEILRPNGFGVNGACTPSAGNSYQCCDEAVANDDTDYVFRTASTFDGDLYAMDDTALTTETVDSLDLKHRSKVAVGAGSGDESQAWIHDGAQGTGTTRAMTTSYQDWEDAAMAKPSGGSWAVSDLNAMQAGFRLRENGTSETRCTQVFIEVNWTAAATANGPLAGGKLAGGSLAGGRLAR